MNRIIRAGQRASKSGPGDKDGAFAEGKWRSIQRGADEGETGKRFGFGDGGSGFTGADQRARQIAGRARDAHGGYRGGDGGEPPCEQLHGHGFGYIDFHNPVNLGEIVILKSHVNRVFNTSLEIGVEVFSENILTGERKQTTTAYVTFVAIDEVSGRPKPVPPLIVKTPEEKRRWREAAKRREIRLTHRKTRKK
jgi:hypothetical protein